MGRAGKAGKVDESDRVAGAEGAEGAEGAAGSGGDSGDGGANGVGGVCGTGRPGGAAVVVPGVGPAAPPPCPELQLTGHGWLVLRLAAVPVGTGRACRALLASGDSRGTVRLWDPVTGAPHGGPVQADPVSVRDLAAVRLADGSWALAVCGTRSVTLWDPDRFCPGTVPLRRLPLTCGRAMAVVPATEGTPELLVAAGSDRVRVLDPGTGATLYSRRTPRRADPGSGIHRLAGLALDEGTPAFAALRHDGDVEVWSCSGDGVRGRFGGGTGRWPTRELGLGGRRVAAGAMTVLTHGAAGGGGAPSVGAPLLALGFRRGVELWSPSAGHCTARADFGHAPASALAPVPLGDGRTVLAAGFGTAHYGGVRLWDPTTACALGPVFNRHGPAFGVHGRPYGVTVNAVLALPGADGTVRVASGAGDGVVRVSTVRPGRGPAGG